jgi:hypothetical protein
MATFNSLTKTELKHLRENSCATLVDFKAVAAAQKRWRDSGHFSAVSREACYECKAIARKLGLPV